MNTTKTNYFDNYKIEYEPTVSLRWLKLIGFHRRAKRQQLAASDERAEVKANAHIQSRAFLERKLGKSYA